MPERDHSHWARTKIVATVGPACETAQQLGALVDAGVDVFRLNMAHGGPQRQQAIVDRLGTLSRERARPLAILVDLAGPKIRLGDVEGGSIYCAVGEEFFLVDGPPSGRRELSASYEPLVRELSAGDTLMLADGTVGMRVEEIAGGRARLRVVQQGTIRSRQGINVPGARLGAPALGPEDRQNAEWAARAGVDYISVSFVRAPEEVGALREIIRSCDSTAGVIAKIEKREALDRLEEIVAAADGVMVARGDLGVEVDVAEVPMLQKRIVRTCQELHKP